MSRYKYYVNGVLQVIIPQAPDRVNSVKLTEKAVIGTKDKVSRHCYFEVEDIAAYNEFVLAHFTIATDENNNYLVDEQGRYIYIED